MITHLLDRLTWAFCSEDFTHRPLQLFIHPELQNKPWDHSSQKLVSKYVALDSDRFHTILDHFVKLSDGSQAVTPYYHGKGYVPSASIEAEVGTDQTTLESSLGHPSSWADKMRLLGHVKTSAVAIDHIHAKQHHQITANIWVLAVSLLFTLHVSLRLFFGSLSHILIFI